MIIMINSNGTRKCCSKTQNFFSFLFFYFFFFYFNFHGWSMKESFYLSSSDDRSVRGSDLRLDDCRQKCRLVYRTSVQWRRPVGKLSRPFARHLWHIPRRRFLIGRSYHEIQSIRLPFTYWAVLSLPLLRVFCRLLPSFFPSFLFIFYFLSFTYFRIDS